ncbi:hypothetical protein MAR_035661 [Mya arenaria]|uniref:Uncharacterized protein n=1 Tax=Mya arenaria TaxID=6604 RepID=A0ABY7EN03_MYAAR|nr:hypothetical protein MAR_035661 [Mya arenaria]
MKRSFFSEKYWPEKFTFITIEKHNGDQLRTNYESFHGPSEGRITKVTKVVNWDKKEVYVKQLCTMWIIK